MRYFAGIGSRDIPKDYAKTLYDYAKLFVQFGFILRSGGAPGSDTICEFACDSEKGEKEIFLPWKGFNNNSSLLFEDNPTARILAEHYHPAWDRLSDAAKKLHSRNVHQVLGKNLDTPVEFVLCYTPDGKEAGGTAQAMRIAKDYKIPIFNVGGNTLPLDNYISGLTLQETFK